MPVSVHLDFIPPNDVPNVTKLLIWEATSKDGPWDLIETVTEVGPSGNYLSEYTTDKALHSNDWFSIEWQDSKGASLGQSQGVQGGAESLVSEIVDRVLLRDPSVNEQVAGQEAEAVVEQYFGTTDSLSIMASDATANELSGLTLLTLVRSKLVSITSTTSAGYTAGLVSQQGGSTTSSSIDDLKKLIQAANSLLGTSYSVILQMADNEIAGGEVILGAPDVLPIPVVLR